MWPLGVTAIQIIINSSVSFPTPVPWDMLLQESSYQMVTHSTIPVCETTTLESSSPSILLMVQPSRRRAPSCQYTPLTLITEVQLQFMNTEEVADLEDCSVKGMDMERDTSKWLHFDFTVHTIHLPLKCML